MAVRDEERTLISPIEERELVFNMVWTGRVFDQLRIFTESMLEHCSARFRFLANACPPTQVEAMERFAVDHPGRVVEVLVVSDQKMVRHGDALDAVLASRDDGEFFCFVDPDIFARRAFLGSFCDELSSCAAVTSGRELWADHNVRPEGHIGVNGEYFFDQDGFVFGSPHFAIYRRRALVSTIERWNVGFSSAGNDIPDDARLRLKELGRDYWIFDTGKIVNTLLQGDGHVLRHVEHPDLLHIGGVSHYLAPPTSVPDNDGHVQSEWGLDEHDWGSWDGMAARYAMAEYTAAVLRALSVGEPSPPVPTTAPDEMRYRLDLVRTAVSELAMTFGAPLVTNTDDSAAMP